MIRELDIRVGGLLRKHGVEKRLTEVQLLISYSCLNRYDYTTAAKHLRDWGVTKQIAITKFVPGDHYHIEGTKYDTYAEAKNYAESLGFTVSGVRYQYFDTKGE